MSYQNTVVWRWANDTKIPTDDPEHDSVVFHIRRRKDMPNRFPNRRRMLEYLTRTGCLTFALDTAWMSYQGYNQRAVGGPYASVPSGGYAEAKRTGSKTYHGTECHKPGHGTLKRTSTQWCIACHREANRDWVAQKHRPVMVQTPEVSEQEQIMLQKALHRSRDRR